MIIQSDKYYINLYNTPYTIFTSQLEMWVLEINYDERIIELAHSNLEASEKEQKKEMEELLQQVVAQINDGKEIIHIRSNHEY